jgi:hypothetical protein
MFETKRGYVTGVRREIQNKDLHNLYFSQNIIHIIRSGRMNVTWIWNWIHVVQDEDQWQDLVNMRLNLRLCVKQ